MTEGEKVYVELKEPVADYEQAIDEAEKIGEDEDLFDGRTVRCVDEAYVQTSV
jgi:hypothetical protein